jgi:hypothetical protein
MWRLLGDAIEGARVVVEGSPYPVHLLCVEESGDTDDPFAGVKITVVVGLDAGAAVHAEIDVSREQFDNHAYLIGALLNTAEEAVIGHFKAAGKRSPD